MTEIYRTILISETSVVAPLFVNPFFLEAFFFKKKTTLLERRGGEKKQRKKGAS